MSVTMARTDGVTVFTLTYDPQSACPPLCQILKGLCYSPVCCSMSQCLRRIQGTSQSVLGALHIMVGLLNIGLGAILFASRVGVALSQMRATVCPFWLGLLVIINVMLNLAGVAFAMTAIIFYSINIANIWLWWICYNDYSYGYGSRYNRPTLSPQEKLMKEKCLEGTDLTVMLVRGINGVLIILSVLELCVTISSVVMGIEALRSSEKREDKSPDDPEHYKPLLEQVTSNPTV